MRHIPQSKWPREKKRLLSLLSAKTADIELPSINPVINDLLDKGLLQRLRTRQEQWNGRWHTLTTIAASNLGVGELKKMGGAPQHW